MLLSREKFCISLSKELKRALKKLINPPKLAKRANRERVVKECLK
jgi:hypothetical protein